MGKFVHRVGGSEIPRFGGMRKECDPGALPPEMFREAINVRYKGKGGPMLSRPGQAKLNGIPLTGGIMGIFSGEYQLGGEQVDLDPNYHCADSEIGLGGLADITKPSLYIVGGNSDVPGLHYFNELQFPLVRHQAYDPAAAYDSVMAAFGDGTLWTCGIIGGTVHLKTSVRGSLPTVMALIPLIGSNVFGSIEKHEGLIYFSVGAPSVDGDTRVYQIPFTGGPVVVDDTPGRKGVPFLKSMGTGQGLYSIHGAYDVFIGAGGGKIRRKATSGSGWVELVMSLSTFQCVGPPAVYKNALWTLGFKNVAGSQRTAVVLKIQGTTVTTARDIGGADGSFYMFPTVFNNYLYYLYHPAGTSNFFVGRFDGTTWDDTHKDLGGQFGTGIISGFLTFSPAYAWLGVLEGELVAILRGNAGSCPYSLLTSPGTNTGGAWVEKLPTLPGKKVYIVEPVGVSTFGVNIAAVI